MGFFQKLLNAAPGPTWQFVLDKWGGKFWYCWDEDYSHAFIVHFGQVVGEIKLLWPDDEDELVLELADIVLWRKEHHQRGVGAALMREIKILARQEGMKAIVGFIVANPDAHVTLEYLRKWYRRQGFQISPKGALFMPL